MPLPRFCWRKRRPAGPPRRRRGEHGHAVRPLAGDAANPSSGASKMGTPGGESGWADFPPGDVTEVAAYVVRIRVR
jgi:hypothetical protein